MSIGEVWSNKDRGNFLRENKIYLNKVKLFEKIQNFKRHDSKRGANLDHSNIFGSTTTITNLNTLSQIGTGKSLASNHELVSHKSVINNLTGLRRHLADLHSGSKVGQKLCGIVKELEGESENWQRLEDKYFAKLIEMF